MTTKKTKELILHVGEKNQQIRAWLVLVSGIRQFTSREIDVLEVLLTKREELTNNQIKGKYLSELLFSTNSRKEYIQSLRITDFNFTNILSSIKKKGGIVRINAELPTEYEDIDSNLIPADEILIKLVTDD